MVDVEEDTDRGCLIPVFVKFMQWSMLIMLLNASAVSPTRVQCPA